VVELEPARPRRLLAVTFHGVPGEEGLEVHEVAFRET
jgi:hypothetical protein